MKLTITWQSDKGTVSKQFSLRQLVSASVLLSLFFIVSSRSTDSVSEDIARIQNAQSTLMSQSTELEQIEESLTSQMHVYASELAEIKQSVSLLHSKNKQLAKSLDITLPDLTEEESINPLSPPPHLLEEIQEARTALNDQISQLSLLEKVYLGHHVDSQVAISGRPVKWGWLSSHYGFRDDPFTGKIAMHKGVDFAGEKDGDVIATGAGIITWAGQRYGYGLLVEIDHGHGLVTRYGHNSALNVVVGDVVTKGQTIAAMGSTGRSTGVHVHYEVLKHGKQVDPLAYLR